MKKTKPRGRPAIASARGRPLSIRLLPDELDQFRAAADADHDTLSGWMRRTLLRESSKIRGKTA